MTIDEMLNAAEHVSRYSPSPSAELITGLANAVRQLTEQRDALVADNWNLRDVLRQLITARPGGVYFNKWEPLIFKALNESPAAAAAFSSLRAEGVEMFAAQERAIAARRESKGMDDSFIKKLLEAAENAEEFSKELRGNKGAQL